MIKITKKTKNTPEIRLKIYQEVRKELLKEIKKGNCANICWTINKIIDNSSKSLSSGINKLFYPGDKYISINYPEIWKKRSTNNTFWFPGSLEGTKERVKFIELIIKELKKSLKLNYYETSNYHSSPDPHRG